MNLFLRINSTLLVKKNLIKFLYLTEKSHLECKCAYSVVFVGELCYRRKTK